MTHQVGTKRVPDGVGGEVDIPIAGVAQLGPERQPGFSVFFRDDKEESNRVMAQRRAINGDGKIVVVQQIYGTIIEASMKTMQYKIKWDGNGNIVDMMRADLLQIRAL